MILVGENSFRSHTLLANPSGEDVAVAQCAQESPFQIELHLRIAVRTETHDVAQLAGTVEVWSALRVVVFRLLVRVISTLFADIGAALKAWQCP